MIRLGTAATLALLGLLAMSTLVSASRVPGADESASVKPTEIQCLDESGRSHVPKKHPRRCALFGPGGAFAGGVNLAKLEWHRWGKARARAEGIEKGFHLPPSHIPVQVVALERFSCGSVFHYGKLRVTSRYGTTTVAVPTC